MLRIRAIIILLLLLTSNAFAQKFTCDDIDKVISTGQIFYEQDDIPYYTNTKALSRLVIYKAPKPTAGEDLYTLIPILFVENRKYYLYFEYWNPLFDDSNAPEIASVYTADFNKNGLNELIIIDEEKGYLREFGSAGHVRAAHVSVDQHTLINKNSCIINPYPYINEIVASRSAKIDGKETCAEGFCTVAQIKRELKRLQHLTPAQFLDVAHKEALDDYRTHCISCAAEESDAALLYHNILTDDTVTILNDMGFFKEQAKEYDKALLILEPIANKYPNRAVVFLNLGDAYFGLNQADKAKTAYGRYVELMKKTGKEKKIPKRVLDALH